MNQYKCTASTQVTNMFSAVWLSWSYKILYAAYFWNDGHYPVACIGSGSQLNTTFSVNWISHGIKRDVINKPL